MVQGPLSGVRIIDLSQGGAGPYGSMILGDLGAEVIKVEIGRGDISRVTPTPAINGESYHYLGFNRSKKGLALDLRTKTGKQAFYDLVKVSDVVWDNSRAGVLERLGADYETMVKLNPKIICCSITGFGTSGPYRDRTSWDPVVLGLSGFLSICSEPGRPPVRPGPAIADLASGMYGAIGVASALLHREKTGKGQKVDIAMLDTAVSLLAHYATFYFLGGGIPQPVGSGHISVVPFGTFPTKKGYVALGVCWPRIARALGVEWMVDDPRFATPDDRVAHRDELNAILTEQFSKATAEEWLEILYAEDIPAAPVNNVAEALADPQVRHNEMVLSVKHASGKEVKMTGNPVKMPGLIEGEYLAPPTLGQHTDEILSQLLGYSPEKIRQLKKEQQEHASDTNAHIRKAK